MVLPPVADDPLPSSRLRKHSRALKLLHRSKPVWKDAIFPRFASSFRSSRDEVEGTTVAKARSASRTCELGKKEVHYIYTYRYNQQAEQNAHDVNEWRMRNV